MVSTFNKKAKSLGYFELIIGVVLLFLVAVAWVVTNNVGGSINNAFLGEDDLLKENTTSRDTLTSLDARKSTFFDGGFAILFISIIMLGGISAWYSGNNPIFFVITLILIITVLVIPYFLGEAWVQLSDNFDDSSEISFMSFIMNNYMIFAVVFVFFMLGVMFFKARSDL